MLTGQQISDVLKSAFIQQPYTLAMWQGGSAAFNRSDEWSDLDMMLIVEDGCEQQAMHHIQAVLENEFGIDTVFVIDPPHWPGMVQTFFRLKNTSPFLLIDFSVLPVSATDKFAEPEIHGNAVVLFDKAGVIAGTQPADAIALKHKLKHRVATQQHKQHIFWVMVDKELNRNNAVDGFIFYWSYTLAPLVEMLRIIHAPHYWNFGSRYLTRHLPADIAAQLQQFYFVKDLSDLKDKNQQARIWLRETILSAEKMLKDTTG